MNCVEIFFRLEKSEIFSSSFIIIGNLTKKKGQEVKINHIVNRKFFFFILSYYILHIYYNLGYNECLNFYIIAQSKDLPSIIHKLISVKRQNSPLYI